MIVRDMNPCVDVRCQIDVCGMLYR